MSESELKKLFYLANVSEGDVRQIAIELFTEALKRSDWAQDGELLGPLAAAWETLGEAGDIAIETYQQILVEANNQIVNLKKRVDQLERLHTTEGLYNAVLTRLESFKSTEEMILAVPNDPQLRERIQGLMAKVQSMTPTDPGKLFELLKGLRDLPVKQ